MRKEVPPPGARTLSAAVLDAPEITDAEYDALMNRLKKLES